MLDVAILAGTRPEAIKLIPVLRSLRTETPLKTALWLSGQHTSMVDSVLESFGESPDLRIDSPNPSGSLTSLTAILTQNIGFALAQNMPRLVVVQGDTTSAFTTALTAYYNKIAVAHVEAGLRTGDKFAPFPEEINRALISPLADLHFAPTIGSAENLLREGVKQEKIIVTGNTVIDALLLMVSKVRAKTPSLPAEFPRELITDNRRIVLITGHRRENFGEGFQNICRAIKILAEKFPEVAFVYPVHLNQNVQKPVNQLLSRVTNIFLVPPLDYSAFVWAMDRSYIILSDSGGVQEEAPSLGKPLLVMRDTTERPEAVACGSAKLVGTDQFKIIEAVSELLSSEAAYKKMSQVSNPFGDGKASSKIAAAIAGYLDK